LPMSPNPMTSARGVIRFELTKKNHASVSVYNISGRLVRTLLSAERDAGLHEVTWDGTDTSGRKVASGLYFYRLRTPEQTMTQKVVLSR
ncbi:MAG: T9SS type A sorting domain-containing protein, partial [Candidatus Eisenbacteria bacterium]|nr:T9SS type A sorting domain-containing protein [Candidatus Eisenbacteria bacterium]